MNDSALIEETRVVDLEALEQRCLGNLDLVARILGKFKLQLDSDLAELTHSLATNDIEAFALVAHRIKGMSANVEAGELHRHASTAEQCALARAAGDLPRCLELMRQDRESISESLS